MTSTLGPNLSRLVRAATAAIVVIGSGMTIGDERRSENHTESIPVPSHRSMNRQRNAAPSSVTGHGPGITPMRYLIRTERSYHAPASEASRPPAADGACGPVSRAVVVGLVAPFDSPHEPRLE